MSLESHLDDIVIGILHEFDISAVSLQKWSYLLQRIFDLLFHVLLLYHYYLQTDKIYDRLCYKYITKPDLPCR